MPVDRLDLAPAVEPRAAAPTWRQARRRLGALSPLPPLAVPLRAAVGAVLARPVAGPTDVPVRDSAVDHGWAVAGVGPWTVIPDDEAHSITALPDQHAITVPMGGPLPPGCTAVVPWDGGVVDLLGGRARLQVADPSGAPAQHPGLIRFGSGIHPRGSDATAGQTLLAAGAVVTPGTVALAAAVGLDDLTVVPPASVAVVLPQYGLSRRGALRPARQRDVVAELLPTWIEAGSARLLPPAESTADAAAIAAVVTDLSADVIVVAGGIDPRVPQAVGAATVSLGAEVILSRIAITPGGAVEVYRLPDERIVVALPGRASAAAAALAVVLDPLLSALSGRGPAPEPPTGMLSGVLADAGAGPGTRLLPAVVERSELVLEVHPMRWHGPAGMHALAAADALVVLDPPTAPGEALVPLLPLPGVLLG
jgi:molybdopterin molybdotransferase